MSTYTSRAGDLESRFSQLTAAAAADRAAHSATQAKLARVLEENEQFKRELEDARATNTSLKRRCDDAERHTESAVELALAKAKEHYAAREKGVGLPSPFSVI